MGLGERYCDGPMDRNRVGGGRALVRGLGVERDVMRSGVVERIASAISSDVRGRDDA